PPPVTPPTRTRRRPPGRRGPSTPRQGWDRAPISRAASISAAKRSPRPGEQLVVVGGGGAARLGEPSERRGRRAGHHLGVHFRPGPVEGRQPLEEGAVGAGAHCTG